MRRRLIVLKALNDIYILCPEDITPARLSALFRMAADIESTEGDDMGTSTLLGHMSAQHGGFSTVGELYHTDYGLGYGPEKPSESAPEMQARHRRDHEKGQGHDHAGDELWAFGPAPEEP